MKTKYIHVYFLKSCLLCFYAGKPIALNLIVVLYSAYVRQICGAKVI